MERIFVRGIPVLILDENESKLEKFYLKYKDQNISEISRKLNREIYEVRTWLEAGKKIFEAR